MGFGIQELHIEVHGDGEVFTEVQVGLAMSTHGWFGMKIGLGFGR